MADNRGANLQSDNHPQRGQHCRRSHTEIQQVQLEMLQDQQARPARPKVVVKKVKKKPKAKPKRAPSAEEAAPPTVEPPASGES